MGNIKGYLLHEIYVNKTSKTFPDILQRANLPKTTGSIFIVAEHSEHLHIVHDCTYTSNTCRCSRLRFLQDELRRVGRKNLRTRNISNEHWQNLIKYFNQGSRLLHQLEIGGETWILGDQVRRLQFQGCKGAGQEKLVEDTVLSFDILHPVGCGSDSNESGPDTQNDNGEVLRKPRIKKRNQSDCIREFILGLPTAPLNLVFSLPQWIYGPYKYLSKRNTKLEVVMNLVRLKYCDMSIQQLHEHVISTNCISYNAFFGNVDSYYYDMEKSVYLLDELLLFQYDNDTSLIINFLRNLYDVCEKVIPKKNAFFVLGQPNAGKNLFFDAVVHSFLNFGQIGNFNKYSNFPLQDCVNRRILIWNEPVMEGSAEETLKLIFGGDTCNVKIKFESDAIVSRTPIIILSNYDCFPKNEAFRTRMFYNKWKTCPALKNVTKKPNPASFYMLLKKYKICD